MGKLSMSPDVKKLAAVSIVAIATILTGASKDCKSKPGVDCNQDDCCRTYCLGPENYGVNAPVAPTMCNGDVIVSVSGLYWGSNQDGMAYAIRTKVLGTDSLSGNGQLNTLIDAEYKDPNFGWDFGFKLGVAYVSPCDGWDIGLNWTYFRANAKDHIEAEFDDNQTLLPLWSAFQYPTAGNAPILFASDIETKWKLQLHLVDVELGRKFWTSRLISLRPFVGVRFANISQDFDIQHKGGSFNDPGTSENLNDYVDLDNDFKGAGLRFGLDSIFNLGCGWGLYGNLATSIIYGKFDIEHDEYVRSATSPFTKTSFLETKDHFRVSRAILDLGLGLQWQTLFCECKYGVRIALGWEQHVFFHQNQMWRVVRLGGSNTSSILNPTGENVFHQRRGSLSTQGWTLTGNFSF